MRLITACVLAIPALVWWPVDVVRHHLRWRRVRREAEARRRDYDAEGWV